MTPVQHALPGLQTTVRQPLTEKQLQQAVIDLARTLGWRVAHFRSVPVKRGPTVRWETPVAADGAGFPDLVLVRDGDRVIFAELKVSGNKPSAAQQGWLTSLRRAKADVHIWTEREWWNGDIEKELR